MTSIPKLSLSHLKHKNLGVKQMKKAIKLLCLIIVLVLIIPGAVLAREGDCGYEGGISSGEAPGKTSFEYQEVSFITGEPLVFKGTLTIKRSTKQDSTILTYTYSLRNVDRAATLTRTQVYETKTTKEYNGQLTEKTTLTRKPTETIRIGGATYTLRDCDFTRSNLIDPKPAINYYAGEIWWKKVYQTGTQANGGTITVEATGSFYGYDQYWGTSEVQTLRYLIKSEQRKGKDVDEWGGTANIALSSTTVKRIGFVENEPQQISFDGGYVQTQYNNSVLKYDCQLPEFDSKGIATDKMLARDGSLQIETFPVKTRLPVPNIKHLRGHWAENDIRILYSLEVFKGDDSSFNPQHIMQRAEFAAAIIRAAREVPAQAEASKTPARTTPASSKNKKEPVVSPFKDVSVDNKYFNEINEAFKRGIINGVGNERFDPNGFITTADAVVVFIRAVGLENLGPDTGAVTTFRDNDLIPSHARNAIYVAQKIGLIKGDNRGYLNPNEFLTKGRAAALINRFIDYMRSDIGKDYRERIINYQ